MNLVRQVMETRLCVATELLLAYSTYGVARCKGYNVNSLFTPPIIPYDLHSFEGPISFHAQKNFAKAVRTAMHYFIITPTDSDLGWTIAQVVAALHSCKWLTDVASVAILRDATKMYPPSGSEAEGALYFPDDSLVETAQSRLLRDQCSQLINTEAATNIDLLSHLPEFESSPDSPHTTTEVAEEMETPGFSHAQNDSLSKIRMEGFLRDFIRPAFP